METAVVSLVCIALIVFGGMTMSRGFLTSVDTTSAALANQSTRDENILRTELTPTDATLNSSTDLHVTLRNSGQMKLAAFDEWDVIVEYYDSSGVYYVTWLPNVTGVPASNQWRKYAIYQDGNPEVFEPNILNPGEDIEIEANLSPAVGRHTTNLVVISTPNGVPVSIVFYRG